MGTMKTPGVYIVEKNAFPNSVVEVATAVPALIGYTEKADNKGKTLLNKPWRITSMAEFHSYYGYAPKPRFEIKEKDPSPAVEAEFGQGDKQYVLNQSAGKFMLYRCMQMFFKNGGGPCYIVSVGKHAVKDAKGKETEGVIKAGELEAGIKTLIKEQEPTMVVIPDAMLLKEAKVAIGIQQAMIKHCGEKMKNRVAILDVYDGYKERQDPSGDPIANFRDKLGINNLDFAAAYYPLVNTTIVQDDELSFENIANLEKLQELLIQEARFEASLTPKDEEKQKEINSITGLSNGSPAEEPKGGGKEPKPKGDAEPSEESEDAKAAKRMLNKSLIAMSPMFNNILAAIKFQLNQLPPAAAMAGIYTMVDNSRGVWKAPANVSLNAVDSPAVTISHDDQEDLNVTTQGKSINAIRSFIGEGTLVWGARTLDGNSLDWRYINVRRTMIMLEESIRLATKAYVFEPNVANTWVTIRSMIRNFLTGIWKRGGLAGAVPGDAFSVHVGLGETMTAEDILEGILRVTVLVAVSRPAEFIEITFQQQMQKS